MPLNFQDPALLWLSAAAVVPLAAHLVSRTRPPQKFFTTVEFLRRAMKKVWRWRKPQDWLLLILRTLAIAALALAFPRPVWLGGEGLAGAGEGKSLVLIVDRTASMGAVEGGQSRFAVAKARALEALRSGGRLDSVNLVWLDATPDAVYPKMGRSVAPLELALQVATVTGEAGDGAAALRVALERLGAAGGAGEIIVVSDFQANTWKPPLPAIPPQVRVMRVPVSAPDAGNLSIAALEVQPSAPFAGEQLTVHCRVRNQSGEARTVNVALTLGEQRLTRTVEVQAWGEAQVVVNPPAPPTEGEFMVQATLTGAGDALRGDDTRGLSLRVRDGLRVALLLPDTIISAGEMDTWQRVLRSFSWVRLTDATSSAVDVLVLAGNDEATEHNAAAALGRGASLLFRPTASAPSLKAGFASLTGVETGRWEKRNSNDAGWKLRVREEDAPLFQLFSTGEYGDPVRGLLRERSSSAPVAANASLPPGWSLLMVYDDLIPALWQSRTPQGGSLWWWNLPMDRAAGTWPTQPGFLAMVGEAFMLSRPKEVAPPHASVMPGQLARWVPSRFPEGGTIVLMDAADQFVPVSEDAGSGTLTYRTVSPMQPGLYRWALLENALNRTHVLAHTAVNFPEAEMDLRAAPPAVLDGSGSASAMLQGTPDWTTLRDGFQLWPWFVAAALLFLLLEAIAIVLGRRRASAAAAHAISR
jgi:hypothetical protein